VRSGVRAAPTTCAPPAVCSRTVTKQKRERKERAEAAAKVKRATDRARREREAFAKKIEAARKAAKTVATGIVDDVE